MIVEPARGKTSEGLSEGVTRISATKLRRSKMHKRKQEPEEVIIHHLINHQIEITNK
jgi:hypothetical protein